MFDLAMDWERCPDGVEFFDCKNLAGEPTVSFRYRTERREIKRLEISSLENTIGVRFMNARDDDARAQFFSRFGFLGPKAGWYSKEALEIFDSRQKLEATPGIENHDNGSNLTREGVEAMRKNVAIWVARAGSGDPKESVMVANKGFEMVSAGGLFPEFRLDERGQRVLMVLKPQSLIGFMLWEAALVALHGARLATCEHCGIYFLTGPKTGHRSDAKYHADKCRVAAMRKRNATNGKHGDKS
jgi:hypothetical protein